MSRAEKLIESVASGAEPGVALSSFLDEGIRSDEVSRSLRDAAQMEAGPDRKFLEFLADRIDQTMPGQDVSRRDLVRLADEPGATRILRGPAARELLDYAWGVLTESTRVSARARSRSTMVVIVSRSSGEPTLRYAVGSSPRAALTKLRRRSGDGFARPSELADVVEDSVSWFLDRDTPVDVLVWGVSAKDKVAISQIHPSITLRELTAAQAKQAGLSAFDLEATRSLRGRGVRQVRRQPLSMDEDRLSGDDMAAAQAALARSTVEPHLTSRDSIELTLFSKPTALPSGQMVRHLLIKRDGTWSFA